MTTLFLIPRGKPSPFCAWSDAAPRAINLTRETATDWYGTPVANSACPILQWPKFAWEQVTAVEVIIGKELAGVAR